MHYQLTNQQPVSILLDQPYSAMVWNIHVHIFSKRKFLGGELKAFLLTKQCGLNDGF